VLCCCRIVKGFSYPYGTLKFPMRQLLALLLSLGATILLATTPLFAGDPAQPAGGVPDKGIELAQQALTRVMQLVDAGALPRVRIEQAEANLEDAKDEVVLAHDLYGDLPENGASEEASAEMIAAAQRRMDRQQARLDDARKMLDAGVVAKTYLAPFEAELTSRQTSLDLAHLRARLMADRAAAKSQQPTAPAAEEPFIDDSGLALQGMEHYEGDGAFNEARDLPPLEWAFTSKFARPLPISAEGETELHRALGFDHRGLVDVAVVPTAPEGVWLRQYLQSRKIPYYAFSHAIPGKATAAHIHIGPGSTRLVSNQLSKHLGTHTHNAD
jgi:cellobiose-specific phosphotransferase system component IIA